MFEKYSYGSAEGESVRPKVAYFSMEIALGSDIPTYCGGLGVLAGDTLRAAADAELPVAGVSLAYDRGYFRQELDPEGNQTESGERWNPHRKLEKIPISPELELEGEVMVLGAWRYDIVGRCGHSVPVYLLHTNLKENTEEQRSYPETLYDGDTSRRIAQEAILGIGGVKLLDALGLRDIPTYHMNEGHSSFLTLALLKRYGDGEEVRKRCVFTTHTPVPAGHDRFDHRMVNKMIPEYYGEREARRLGGERLNMSELGIRYSRYVNGVSEKHGRVAGDMFPRYEIGHITNGIHLATWLHPRLRDLYRERVGGWEEDPHRLEDAAGLDSSELLREHVRIKRDLLEHVGSRSRFPPDPELFTMGYARRITSYKRPCLILEDPDRLGEICRGKARLLMAGKTHPDDKEGKELIRRIFSVSRRLRERYGVPVIFLNDYDMALAEKMVSGVDLWLNTPERYMEASGTSGMKAAVNGVPNFSVLDGWWI